MKIQQKHQPAVAHLAAPAEFKFANHRPGTFSGYCAVFGNLDSGGDVLERGAFKEVARNKAGRVRILYQHSPHDPIGTAEVREDDYGLRVDGELALDDATAAKAYALMKSGVLDGMSIGYAVLPGGAEYLNSGARLLKAVKLFEISVTTFPMDEAAVVDEVKTLRGCQSPRELERFLREVPTFQLSSRKAKAAANALWPILTEREAQEDDRDDREEAEQLAIKLNSITNLLKGNTR